MSDRTDIQSILTRALVAAAAPQAHRGGAAGRSADLFAAGPAEPQPVEDLEAISEDAHRLLADLIMLLLLELEGLVDSPLNIRARARVRLGAPSRSRILADWPGLPSTGREDDLFPAAPPARPLPRASDPDAFFAATLHSARVTARSLGLRPGEIEEMIRWLLPVIARCAPEDDPVGWIHAHGQRHRLTRGPGNRLRFQVDRERGRSHGVLYTPPPLTEALVEAVLSAWGEQVAPASATLFEAKGGDARKIPQILDPSCGSGQFLLSATRHLLREGDEGARRARPEEILAIFQSMHGVDIDPGAAMLAAFNLSLQAVRAICRSQGADPPLVVRWLQEQLGPRFPWFLGGQIHQGNALLLAATPDGTTFRWTERFASIFSGDRPGFDIVIGNPPWVSYGLRDRAGPEEEESTYLRGLYTFGAQYKLSLYPLFIELALRLTRPAGLHGFLVPDSFFTGRHFSRIRAHILETSHPLLFCLVESGPWPGVHVGHTAFYAVRKLPAPGPFGPVTTCALQLPPYSRRPRRRPASSLPLFAHGIESMKPVHVDVSVFRTTPHHTFRIFRDEEERRFVEDIERASMRFEQVVETYSGLIARFGQEGVMGRREGPFVLKDRHGKIVHRDPEPGSRWRPALHSGAEVEPFRTKWRGGMLYIPDDYESLRNVYKSGFDLERYMGEKIFLRQTGDRLVAARDDRALFCLNNVHILTSRKNPEIDLRFLCGLLLCEPIQRYYQIVALEAGRPLAQVDLVTIQTIPFPCDSSGAPFGEVASVGGGRAPGRWSRRIGDALAGGRTEVVFDLAEKACRAGSGAAPPDEDRSGRELASAMVCQIVETLERTEEERSVRIARDALDGVFRILFGLPVTKGTHHVNGAGIPSA